MYARGYIQEEEPVDSDDEEKEAQAQSKAAVAPADEVVLELVTPQAQETEMTTLQKDESTEEVLDAETQDEINV